jgi:hypothetical protein
MNLGISECVKELDMDNLKGLDLNSDTVEGPTDGPD